MKKVLLIVLAIGSICLTACKNTEEEKTTKPNILLIYTDQQRYNTIQALGNEFIKTPNLDRLVNSGVAFTQAFVSAPVCLPSRSSLFSGLYTTSHGSYSNHHRGQRPKTNLLQELKKIGYQTALYGKNHSFLDSTDLDILYNYPPFIDRPDDGRNAMRPLEWEVEDDPMRAITDSTMTLLSKNKDKSPTFVWLSYIYPHTPYGINEPYYSMYDSVAIPEPVVEPQGLEAANKPFRQVFHQENNDLKIPYGKEQIMRVKRNYYGMISMIDDEIGRLLDFLDENGIRENTLIVFTSDHGDYMGDHHMITKSPAMYDCLTRVPLIFNWKGTTAKNMISEELISNVDIMPTVLSLVDTTVPNNVQGMDFSSYLKGGNGNGPLRNYVYSEYGIPGKPLNRESLKNLMPDYNENPITFNNPKIPWEANPIALSGRFRMIRDHEWKFVQNEGGISELYDLKNDPNELVNLWGEPRYEKVQKRLERDLNTWKSKLPGIDKDTMNMGKRNLLKYLEKRNSTKVEP